MGYQLLSAWKTTSQNRPIDLAWSSEQNWSSLKNPLVIIGGVHGDEPEGVNLATATLAWLQQNHKNISKPWMLIPNLNPDGAANGTRVNGRGVDLNRNYPSKGWSPVFEKQRYNPGPQSGSEVETQAVVEIIRTVKPRLVVHCHSWNPCIVCTGEPAKPHAEALSRSCGYKVVDDIGYETPGSLSEYGWIDNKVPVICIEEREGAKADETWTRFQTGMKEILSL